MLMMLAAACTACIDPSIAQTPRTLPPGEHTWNASGGVLAGIPTVAIGARLGLTDHLDAGLRIGPGPIQIDGKYNFLRSKYFDLSGDAAFLFSPTFYASSADGRESRPPAPYFFVPSGLLIAGVNLGSVLTLVPFGGVVMVNEFEGISDGVWWLGRAGLGVNLAFPDANMSLQPEGSVAGGLGGDTRGLGYSGSISAIWGRGPR